MKNILAGCNNLKRLKTGANFVYFSFNLEKSIILEKLTSIGYVIVSPKTGSMLPMLRPKLDQAVFSLKHEYKKNDIILYKNEDGTKLIMHRVERVFSKGYLTRGDNAYYAEYVPKENVFAAATEIYRKNKKNKCDSMRYKLISFLCINYNLLLFEYRRSDKIFWRIARKIKRKVF